MTSMSMTSPAMTTDSHYTATAPALIALAVVRERRVRPCLEAAAEQSRTSAAQQIFRLQGVYDYAPDAIGWFCRANGSTLRAVRSTKRVPPRRFCVEGLGVGRIIIGEDNLKT
jgi:hypothetical protein